MTGIVVAILAGLFISVASYTSGRASRDVDTGLLVSLLNIFALIVLIPALFLSNELNELNSSDFNQTLMAGLVGGIGFSLGLTLIGKGLSTGRSGIISPLMAVVSVAIPTLYAIALEGVPNTSLLLGLGILLIVPILSTKTNVFNKVIATTKARDFSFGVFSGLFLGVYVVSLLFTPDNLQILMLVILQFASLFTAIIVNFSSTRSWSISAKPKVFVLIFIVSQFSSLILTRLAFNLGDTVLVSPLIGTIAPVGLLVLSRIFNKEFFFKEQLFAFSIMVLGITIVSVNV